MLVLERKRGRSIYIGRNVTITLGETSEDGVTQLIIHAPRHVIISRDDFTFASHLRLQDAADAKMKGEGDGTKLESPGQTHLPGEASPAAPGISPVDDG